MKLFKYQAAGLRHLRENRTSVLLWRRQAGKSTLYAWHALRELARLRGATMTLVSASMAVGAEIPYRVATLLDDLLRAMREAGKELGLGAEVATNAAGLSDDDVRELFKQGKLEVTVRHSATSVSRLKVIAPNIATARGYSGTVLMDEIGFIRDFRGLYEAMEPIISSDPSFRLVMATTPPNDDAHYSYTLAAPEPGTEFAVNPAGNVYVSAAGVPVHRVDAWDAAAAGRVLYDAQTGAPLTPEEHRAQALDRDAWDRNYGLKWLSGGTAALSLLGLAAAQDWGARLGCTAAEGAPPPGWAEKMTDAPWAVGYDIATTEKGASNPSAIVVTQEVGPKQYAERLVLRFKSANDAEAKETLRTVLEDATAATGRRPRGIAVDATSERYFCVQLRREFSRFGRVLLVVSSEATEYGGERMLFKARL
ncbi:MAG: DEAD/DEAH box helicase family protein, partial [Kiritimatiellae bacterium]|nr:DEAD/DEAH box helicase family protein [Kiritimatiellia bacterium]